MALNLVRNSRAFFTTNVDPNTGVIAAGSHATATTSEITILDGFSLSQNTSNETVTISEAGTSPLRGQRSFNTQLAPVDFSFSTYIRPYKSTNVKAEEGVLWNALNAAGAQNTALTKSGTVSSIAYTAATNLVTISGTSLSVTGLAAGDYVLLNGITSGTPSDEKTLNGPAVCRSVGGSAITFEMLNKGSTTAGAIATTYDVYKVSGWAEGTKQAIASMHGSNLNQLQKFGMIFLLDGVTYLVDNCVLTQASIDFGLDGIATVQWTGQGTALKESASAVTATQGATGTFTGGLTGSFTPKLAGAGITENFITNKLSTCTLKAAKAVGSIPANTEYYIALTGGNITINNNVTYVTPSNLGVINKPIGYFTGTRSVSGTLNAYLNTGNPGVAGFTKGTGALLADLLANSTTAVEPMFTTEVVIGGSTNAIKVELQMPSVSIGIPSVNTEQVLSTAINFTAAPSRQGGADATTVYDLTFPNELTVRYYAP